MSAVAASIPRIAIVGGGLSGLVLRLTLHRRSIPAVVYERDIAFNDRAHLGGTLDLGWDSAQRALRENGLQEAFDKYSRPEGNGYKYCDTEGNVIHVFNEDHTAKALEDRRPEIDRSVLRKLLIDAIPTDSVKWNHALVSARPLDGGQHELTFANGTTTVCDILVGADGGNSRIRPLVSPATPSYSGVNGAEISLAPEVVAREDMTDIRELVGAGTISARKDKRMFFTQRNGDGRIRTYAWFKGDESWTLPSEPSEARKVLLELYAGWGPVWLKLIEHCDEQAIYNRPLWTLPPDHRWNHVPGVTLVGDSAHLMSPFAGAGANVAMLGALELGLALADAISNGKSVEEREAAVQAYEEKMFVLGGKQAELSAQNLEGAFQDSEETDEELVEKYKHFLEGEGGRDEAGTRAPQK